MIRLLLIFLCLFSALSYGQSRDQRRIALLEGEVAQLRQSVGQATLRIEVLEAQLAQKETSSSQANAQYIQSLEALRKEMHSLNDQSKQAILAALEPKIDRLCKATAPAPKASSSVKFSENYEKEGICYVVQPGDTLSKIAHTQGSTIADIQNANKIADPKQLQVGTELFIPKKL